MAIEVSLRDEAKLIESVVVKGDISGLSSAELTAYYARMCDALGLTAATQPFALLKLNGKVILYPTRAATDQLAAIHRLNREIIDGPKVVDVAGTKMILAVCRATHPNGRVETAVATVPMQDPINALMKAETKAKRRAVLDLVGLGIPDESEVATIRGARTGSLDLSTGEIVIEAGEPKRERAKSDATVESIRAAAARVVSLSVEPTTVEDVIEWACGKVNVPGVDDYKAPEQLAAVERYLAQAADKMAKRPKSSKPAPSSPDHAGALARVMRLVDELALLRDWEVEQVLADELRSGVKLEAMTADELETLAQRLDHQCAVEREEAP